MASKGFVGKFVGIGDANAIRRAYTHAAEYWDERVRMMQVWADYLDELRSAPAKKA